MQNREGWFREYHGPDIGYHTTTVSHLGRVWKKDRDLLERETVDSALKFLSKFIDREGYYSGIIGSRNSRHFHPAGIEMLTEDFETAQEICDGARKNHEDGNLLEPAQMDDKHFSRLLAGYLDAYRNAGKTTEAGKVPEQDLEHISIRRKGDELVYINTSKGGVYKRYREGELLERDHGISVSYGGETYTSNWPGSTSSREIQEEKISIEGELHEVPRNTLKGSLFTAFRLFNYTAGRKTSLSLSLKDLIIDRLIRGGGTGNHFRRSINLAEELEVEDSFEGEELEGKTRTNFVPCSEFFSRKFCGSETEIRQVD